ncbi:MAG: amidohydrolase [Acidobacteria bacterium]|nr:amidohydrolase [Acidobacteriota bacterium]
MPARPLPSARALPLLLLACSLATAQAPPTDQLRQEAQERVQGRAKLVQVITDSLFSFAELGYQEHETVEYLTGLLAEKGFKIRTGVAGMPTAYVAEWGSGKPILGLMADIDGLPETSQKPGVARHDELIPGGPGHGEGHNAGQAVQVATALAVQEILQKHNMPGTIRVYPGVAEELLGSRTYMAREGLFDDLDAMLSCHVSSSFDTQWGVRGLALVSTQFSFHGVSAHGAGSPWKGRSALDAVELMNIGWNFRREHLRLQQRSHYSIPHGGNQPNVVPSEATVWYFFRELDYAHVKELHALGQQMARAAAMMTDTTMTERIIGAAWEGHFNKPLAELLDANIQRVGMPAWSDEDQRLARAVQKLMDAEQSGLRAKPSPLDGPAETSSGSDDIAEVSWKVPTINLRYPANIPGTVGHHWSSGIAMATPIAHKGALAGAQAQAMTMIELFADPSHLERAKAYFAEQTKDVKWQSLIPDDVSPPADTNAEKMEKFRPALEKLRYDPSKYSSYMEQLGIEYPTVE